MSDIDRTLLTAIANATAANADFYVTQAEGIPLIQHNPPLIAVDSSKPDPADATKRAAQITDAGKEYLGSQNATKPIKSYELLSGIELPKVKRGAGGGGGAPSKYHFDDMAVGQFFFVGNSEVKNHDAVKTVGSAVGAANQKYAEPTGETEHKRRVKRDNKNRAVKDASGANVYEEVDLPVKKQTRKFVARRVEGGKVYGTWTAPEDGAVVSRTA